MRGNKPISWKCPYCGMVATARCLNTISGASYRHRKKHHPETIGKRNGSPKVESVDAIDVPRKYPCDEKCANWTGKSACLKGNMVVKGAMRQCFEWGVGE